MTLAVLRPQREEIAVVLLRVGESVVVETADTPLTATADREAWLLLVPADSTRVGWDWQTRSVQHAVGPADARTPTGLRAAVLQRILRGHKLDEPVWAQARALLGGPARAVYVRQEAVPYYSRTRWAATAVRPAEEPSSGPPYPRLAPTEAEWQAHLATLQPPPEEAP